MSTRTDDTREADLVPGAPCAAEDRRLSNQPEATVPGPSSQQQAANSPATGGPGIDGSPRAGETLTATTSGIADEDGMTGAVFAYQWIRHDPATAADTDIEGATGSTYTVTSADEGKALKVRVTFTDDAGNEESVTSYALVGSPAPTRTREPANSAATGAPGIDGSAVVGQTLTATTTGIGTTTESPTRSSPTSGWPTMRRSRARRRRPTPWSQGTWARPSRSGSPSPTMRATRSR